MSVETAQELFVEELKDIYSAEKQIAGLAQGGQGGRVTGVAFRH